MAKKAHKTVAAKAKKPAKRGAKRKAVVAKRKSAVAKRKTAVIKPPRKAAPAKAAKPAAQKPPAIKPVAGKPAAAPPVASKGPAQHPLPSREGFLQKVEGAVEAVLDTLTDAERLHHKLDPGVPPIPE